MNAPVQCLWIDAKDATKSGYLNFYVAIDRTNIGFFTVTSSYKEPVIDAIDVPVSFTDDYTGNSTTFVLHEINVLPALVTLRLKRTPINIVFPMFIAIGLWMMVAAQVLAFLPFYMGLKYVDAYAVPIAAVSRSQPSATTCRGCLRWAASSTLRVTSS